MRIGFVSWDATAPSGGNTYNEHLVAGLRDAGEQVSVHRLPGPWPAGDAASHARLARALAAEPVALVDGIVASGAPDVVAAAPSRVAVLVHMPIPDDPTLDATTRSAYARRERASLRAAAAVFSPSEHAAADLLVRYGLSQVHVAAPGMDPAPLAAGSRPPRLLVLGAVTPLKNTLAVLEAAEATALAVDVVGSLDVDPAYAARVIAAAGPRTAVHGTLRGAPLEAVWSRTDLLVHAAGSETYGLVVAEALAHGVPALVPAGTGAEEALGTTGAGVAYRPGTLATELARWSRDDEVRTRWRVAAVRARHHVTGWSPTVERVRAVLQRLGG